MNFVWRQTVAACLKLVGEKLGYSVHGPFVAITTLHRLHNAFTYLTSWLVSILAPLVGKSASHMRNSADFATFIAGQSLVSFDVVSLFTRVPVDLTVKVAHKRLSMDTSLIERTSLSADQVVQLLQFCLDATFLGYGETSTSKLSAQPWVPLSRSQ